MARFMTEKWRHVLVLLVVVTVISSASDVTVQQGHLTVSGHATVGDYLAVSENANFLGPVTMSDGLEVSDYIESTYIDNSHTVWSDVINNQSVLLSFGPTFLFDDAYVYGKLTSYGGYDPPYVLYDRQSRDEIVERVKKEVTPDKVNGAAMFFNKETKRLEVYVPDEGKFYDLQGNVVHELAQVVAPSGQYQPTYYMDSSTGEVKSHQKAVQKRLRIKKGFELNQKTGQFASRDTGEVVPKEAALEWYAESEGAYYDLQGKLIRTEPKEGSTLYAVEYRFDSDTGEVKPVRQILRDRYVVKEGYRFDKRSGRFIEEKTGQAVAREQAVQVITAAETADKLKAKGLKVGK